MRNKLGDIILASTPIEISDFPNHKEATFLISVLDEYNSNGVLIEKEEGEKYHNTIVGYPIVAYLKYDKEGKPDDFGGHELRAKYNSETKKLEYYFATHPIGSVTESWIEERDVEGYEGKKDVILIKAKLWKSRFTEYFKAFDKLWEDGKIASSWEISASDSEKTTKGKRLKSFEFIGNALLGSNVTGAVQGAGVLEVAADNDINYELSEAFSKDMQSNSIDNTDPSHEGDNNDPNSHEEGGIRLMGNKNKNTEGSELSALTDNDLYTKVRRAVNSSNEDKYYYTAMLYPYEYKAIAYTWDRASEEDFVQFTYSVNSDDTISITSQEDVKMVFVSKTEHETQIADLEEKVTSAEKEISEAGKAVTELTKEKEALETQVSELNEYKVKVDELEKAEQERELSEKKEELKTFALEDDLISSEELESDEKLTVIFSELTLDNYETSQDKIELIKGRKAIEKCKLSQQNASETVETSTKNKKTKTDLTSGDQGGTYTATEIMKTVFSRK